MTQPTAPSMTAPSQGPLAGPPSPAPATKPGAAPVPQASTDPVREKLQRRAQRAHGPAPAITRPSAPSREETIQQYLDRPENRRLIARLLGRWMSPDRLLALGVTVLRQQPELLSCEVSSLVGALVFCAQVRLVPGPMGFVYFAPFNNTDRGIRQVQPIIGYRGLASLARRSGQLSALHGAPVRQGDYFRYRLGTQPYLEHIYAEDQPADPTQLPPASHYYIVAHYRDGIAIPHVLTRAQVEWHRQFSRAKDTGPWKTHYDAMALKTVIRDAAWRWLPLSLEGHYALARDEQPIESPEELEAIPAEGWVVQEDGSRLPVMPGSAPPPSPAPAGPPAAAAAPASGSPDGGMAHEQLPF